ncbi:MAG: 2-oxo acid dehydrogenase subunit E2 [Magnetococcales bacterium]|nr:2-oxo acid dehydrogenase subunit E2 [Magnetococcales bacterium]
MNTEFKLPNLGENIAGGDVVHVLVTPGMTVAPGAPLLEVETNKAVVEVPAESAMTIQEVLVKPGEHVSVGQVLFRAVMGDVEPKPSAPVAPVVAPVVLRPDAPVVAAAPPAPVAPVVLPAPVASPPGGDALPPSRPGIPVPAAPSVRREARELGVDIREITGTGPGGRISIADVRAHVKQRNQSRAVTGGYNDSRVPMHTQLPDFGRWGTVSREKMKNVRKATAQHMAATWNTVPQVTCHDKADITHLEAVRQRLAPRVQKRGGKLSVTAIMLKVVATALKVFPQFNASVDMASEEIILKRFVHIGVAVDTPRGLIVPVIRDVDRQNISQLAVALTTLSATAREGKTPLEEMQGGSFTVSNLGGIGATGFTPIINYPEVAILGMAKGVLEAVFIDGGFQPRLMLPLSLSFDHRVIDGADGARFLRFLCEALEEPLLLSLEG